MSKRYEIPVYFNGGYYSSLVYKEPIYANAKTRLMEDARKMMEGINIVEIYVGADEFQHLAVFVRG